MSSKIPVAVSFAGVANFLDILGIIGSLVFIGFRVAANATNSARRHGAA